MPRGRCATFFAAQIARAKEEGVLFSVHLKATMMKVSDPDHLRPRRLGLLRRRAREARRYARRLGVNPNNGFGDLLAKIETLPDGRKGRDRGRHRGRSSQAGRALAMVDSDKGITNLHVPSDVIVDASMPAMIRDVGPACGAPTASCTTPWP